MKQRWYDSHPTLSMAISLLMNATPAHREKAITYIQSQIDAFCPNAYDRLETYQPSLWSFLNKRKTMLAHEWKVVEAMRYLGPAEQDTVALETIKLIYLLEHDSCDDLIMSSFTNLEAAM